MLCAFKCDDDWDQIDDDGHRDIVFFYQIKKYIYLLHFPRYVFYLKIGTRSRNAIIVNILYSMLN